MAHSPAARRPRLPRACARETASAVNARAHALAAVVEVTGPIVGVESAGHFLRRTLADADADREEHLRHRDEARALAADPGLAPRDRIAALAVADRAQGSATATLELRVRVAELVERAAECERERAAVERAAEAPSDERLAAAGLARIPDPWGEEGV